MNRRGDVVLVPADFTDRSGAKVRPAVVVSGADFNRGPDRLLAPITGNLHALPHPGDSVLADWQAAGLRKESLVQTKIFVVEASLIVRTVGQVRYADLAAIVRGLRRALDL